MTKKKETKELNKHLTDSEYSRLKEAILQLDNFSRFMDGVTMGFAIATPEADVTLAKEENTFFMAGYVPRRLPTTPALKFMEKARALRGVVIDLKRLADIDTPEDL